MTDDPVQHPGTRYLQRRLDGDARELLSARPVEEWREILRAVDEAGRRAGGIAWAEQPEHDGVEFRQWSDGAGAVAGWFFHPDGPVLVSVFDHESDLNLFAEYVDDFAVQDRMYDGLPDGFRRLLGAPPEGTDMTTDADPRGGVRLWSSGVFVFDGETWSAAPGLGVCMAETPGLFRTDDGVLVNGRGRPVGVDETGLPLILEAIEAEHDRLLTGGSSNRTADAEDSGQGADGKRPLTADTVVWIAARMAGLPFPAEDSPPKRIEWRLGGYEGSTVRGLFHVLVLGDEADAATLRQMTPPAVGALDGRWGQHAELLVSALPAFDRTAENPDPRSILAALATALEGTRIWWWRPDGERLALMTIREEPQEHVTALLVIPPEMLEEPRSTAPAISREDVAGMDLEGIAALAMHYPWSEEERAAFRSPPYPLPAGLVPAIEALEEALPADAEPGSRAMHRAGLPTVVLKLLSHGVFNRGSDAEFLIGMAADSDLPQKDRDLVVRDLLLTLVEVHLAAGDVAAAERTAERVGDVTPATAYYGWREIAAHHAANGDATSFLTLWDRYDARSGRARLSRLRERLVTAVAVREGWRAAAEVCGDKRVGAAFRHHAFEPPAYGYDDLVTLFAGEADGVLDETGELHALVAAAVAESRPRPTEDHRGVEGLLARISALDPDVSRAAMRERDHLLFDLRGAVGDEGTLARLRAQLRTPRLVREAMQLVAGTPEDS